jgi:glycogen synthase
LQRSYFLVDARKKTQQIGQTLMHHAMSADFSWEHTAHSYLELYRTLGVDIKPPADG